MTSALKIDEKIRQGVIESLPEVKQIQNKELRERIYDAWAMALEENGYTKIEEMPPETDPGGPVAKSGTTVEHIRSVARLSVAIVKELKNTFEQFDVDMDEVIAGGICHDIGRPFEYNPRNQKRWSSDPRITGEPSLRHSVYGAHIALCAGLPEKIAHIAAGHSKEGEHIKRSLVAEIVHYADVLFWRILDKAGFLETPDRSA